jgi:Fe-Mn family superoxide dismutase
MADEKKVSNRDLNRTIQESLNLSSSTKESLDEAYVVELPTFDIRSDLLSEKNIVAHFKILGEYVDALNHVSAELDAADRETANADDSHFRSYKLDEVYNLNAAFLHGLYFGNIADPHSQITMDSLVYLRLERDFGTFDAWQKDFIACAMSSRSGWAVTIYNTFLNRYMNVMVDLNTTNIPFGSQPVIVLDMWEHAYYRDYLNDKKTYVFAMMKELNWDMVETRFQKTERIAKAAK